MKAKRHNRIEEVLIENDTTAKQLATMLRRPETVIRQWCENKRQPRLNSLARIADALDVDIRDLLVRTKD